MWSLLITDDGHVAIEVRDVISGTREGQAASAPPAILAQSVSSVERESARHWRNGEEMGQSSKTERPANLVCDNIIRQVGIAGGR